MATFSFEVVDELFKEAGLAEIRAASDKGFFSDPVKAQQRQEELEKILTEQPLLHRYIAHLATTEPHNTQAWQAQGERIYAALCALMAPKITLANSKTSGGEGIFNNKPYQYLGESVDIELSTRFGNSLKVLGSQVYLWTSEIRSMAHSMPLPKHTISRELLPFPIMFWSFETAMSVTDPDTEEAVGGVDWLLLHEERDQTTGEPDGIGVITNFNKYITDTEGNRTEQGDNTILYGRVPYGAIYPDELGEGQHLILALLAFLNTPLLQVTKTGLPRPIRREMKRRKKQNIGDVETNVVTLRRPQSEKSDDPSFGITYRDHRWWVSGHFRAQWYPSAKGHKLIWIAPHLKGPEHKPIKEKTYHVKR